MITDQEGVSLEMRSNKVEVLTSEIVEKMINRGKNYLLLKNQLNGVKQSFLLLLIQGSEIPSNLL
jgi:hypothetical protein